MTLGHLGGPASQLLAAALTFLGLPFINLQALVTVLYVNHLHPDWNRQAFWHARVLSFFMDFNILLPDASYLISE